MNLWILGPLSINVKFGKVFYNMETKLNLSSQQTILHICFLAANVYKILSITFKIYIFTNVRKMCKIVIFICILKCFDFN